MPTELYTLKKGDPANPGVLCLHGLLGASRNLYRLIEAIAASGFYAIGYDQRGHGHSPRLGTGESYSLSLLASDLFRVMDSLGLEKAHLVGHSLGARVCLQAAATEPGRVLSLSMLDAGTKLNEDALSGLRSIIQALPESFPSKQEADDYLSKYPTKLKVFLLSNLRTRDGGTQAWVFDLAAIRRSMWNALAVDQSPQWANLTCPTQVLRGDRSDNFSESELSEMLKLNPRAKAVVISGANHWIHVDNFEETAAAVVSFLQEAKKKG